jgi:branched-chain amino acid transport system substrate-binding protein
MVLCDQSSGWGLRMLSSRFARFAMLAATAAVAALGWCGSVSSAAADDVIRFGAPLPLTGPLAPEGIKQQQGYDLWAEQANKAGGISVGGKKYKVEIVYADYQSNTPRAVQTTEQMIRLGRRQGGEHGLGKVQGADHCRRGVLHPGL